MIDFLQLAVFAVPVAAISITISKAKIFEGARNYIQEAPPRWQLLHPRLLKVRDFIGELISCPYCTSHWVALLFVLLFFPLVSFWTVVARTMTIVALNAPVAWLIFKCYRTMD